MPRLTPEQRALRQTGVGASESAAVVGLSPFKHPVDVWLRKPVGGRPPRVVEEERDEAEQAEVGHALESALLDLYATRTGIKMSPGAGTLRHPVFACVLASPDGEGTTHADPGLEIKLVGERMSHYWTEDSVPDFVLCQAVQNMAVTGRDRWDVFALIGGTTPRIYTIERDRDLEESLLEAVSAFWEVNVVGDVLPDMQDHEERKRYLAARYPGGEKTPCAVLEDPDVEEAIRWREAAEQHITEASQMRDAITDWLCARVGDEYGVEGTWGKFLWYPVRGRVDWQAVAEELAGGAVPVDIIERHRGKGSRVPRFYPPSASQKRALANRR